MNAQIGGYAEYKDSGVAWLGQIPGHWDARRIKTLFEDRVEKGYPDETLLAATQTHGVVPKEFYENRTVVAQKDLHLLKLVEVGDFVISLRSFQGGIEYAHYRGIISPAYTVLTQKEGALPGYFRFLLKSSVFVSALSLFITGIREGQNIDYERLQRTALPLPPLDEQAAIVKYLAHVDRKIDRFIRSKRRMIELLNEQKQSIIHQAVTKGLDPSAPKKDSGVEWLGEIPAHWEVANAGKLVNLVTGFPFKSDDFTNDSDGIRLLRGINVGVGVIRWDNAVRWPLEQADAFSDFDLEVGDVVLGMDRPIIGKGIRVSRIAEDDVPSLLLQRVCRLRAERQITQGFLYIQMEDKRFSDYLAPQFTGISVPHVSPGQIKAYPLVLPPLQEQDEIIECLRKETRKAELSVSAVKREIDLIREYRTRLISDVVTGKIDVRVAAAVLPEIEEAVLPVEWGEEFEPNGHEDASDVEVDD